jgi:hypothetical protein
MVCKVGDGTIPQLNNGDRCANLQGCRCDNRRVYLSTLCLFRDNQPSPIQPNQQCSDPDGCDCNGFRVYNGNMCLIPDNTKTVI